MVRFLLVRCGAIAVALLVPVGVVGAASDETDPGTSVPGSSVPGTSTPGDEPSSGQPPPGDLDFQVDMILGLVPQDEMEAYYQDQQMGRELVIQECMNEAGFEYNPENVDEMFNFDPYNGLSQLEYAEQWGFGMYTMMDPEANTNMNMDQSYEWPNQDVIDALSASEQNAWFEVNNRCSTDAWMEDDPYRNPMVQQAIEDFYTDVENDPRMVAANETWQACMETAGHPYAGIDDMYDTIYAEDKQEEFYETSAWEPDSPNHAEWQAMVEQEIGTAVAHVNCGPPVEDVRMQVVADLRPAFAEVWQTIDWSLPPVTFPGEGEFMTIDEEGVPVDGTISSVEESPDGTTDEPVAIDLSEPVDTSAPPTS